MEKKIPFQQFFRFLRKADYGDREIAHLFHAVREMDRESRGWVIRWFYNGELPQTEVEGVTAEFLIQECGFRPLNAFIILDWLKSDPGAAKYFILRADPGADPSKEVGEEMLAFLRGMGREPREEQEILEDETISAEENL